MAESKEELITFWHQGALQNRLEALDNFKIKHYNWSLFIWHLALEKLLKAQITKHNQTIPWVHNLAVLCEHASIKLTKEEFSWISEINSFNLNTRYDDYKLAFYKKATEEYTQKWINTCERLFKKFSKDL